MRDVHGRYKIKDEHQEPEGGPGTNSGEPAWASEGHVLLSTRDQAPVSVASIGHSARCFCHPRCFWCNRGSFRAGPWHEEEHIEGNFGVSQEVGTFVSVCEVATRLKLLICNRDLNNGRSDNRRSCNTCSRRWKQFPSRSNRRWKPRFSSKRKVQLQQLRQQQQEWRQSLNISS